MAIELDDVKDLRDRFRSGRLYRYGRRLLRALLLSAVFLLMAASTLGVFRGGYRSYIGDMLPPIVGTLTELLMLGLLLNTVLLAFATYRRDARETFLERCHDAEDFRPARERRLFLRDPQLWWETVTLSFLFSVSNASLLWGDLDWLLERLAISPLLLRLPLCLLFTAAVLALSLYGRQEACRHWLDLSARLRRKRELWGDQKKKKENSYRPRRLVLRLLGAFAAYLICAAILPMIIPIGDLILKLGVKTLIYLPVVPLLVLLFIGSYYFRALLQRRRFLRRLRRVCAANRIRIHTLRHPYRSVLRDARRGEYDLLLETPKKSFCCRFVAGVKKTNNVFLSPDGTATRVFAIHAPARRIVVTGRFSQSVSTTASSLDLELIRINRTFDYRFDAPKNAQKILVFNPVPLKVFQKDTGGNGEMDNGMSINDYYVYTGGALIRMLERLLHGDE